MQHATASFLVGDDWYVRVFIIQAVTVRHPDCQLSVAVESAPRDTTVPSGPSTRRRLHVATPVCTVPWDRRRLSRCPMARTPHLMDWEVTALAEWEVHFVHSASTVLTVFGQSVPTARMRPAPGCQSVFSVHQVLSCRHMDTLALTHTPTVTQLPASNALRGVSVAMAGYACRVGTGLLAKSHECDLPSSYCPAGSSSPTPVPDGWYSVPTSTQLFFNISGCPVAEYCTGGVRQLCPPGRFGNATHLSAFNCSGPCTAGYYCDAGSANSTAAPCFHGPLRDCPEVRQVHCHVFHSTVTQRG